MLHSTITLVVLYRGYFSIKNIKLLTETFIEIFLYK